MKDWDEIVKILEKFYRTRGRKYPWRCETDPYKLFVAELMLQRTPADRCVEPYETFVIRFPSCRDLLAANDEEVKAFFSALGLVKRASWLLESCRTVMNSMGGNFPSDLGTLRKLKGCGDYTSKAIYISLRGWGPLPVDANVRRVLGRVFGHWKTEFSKLELSKEAFFGLLDVAALLCGNKRRLCKHCPLRTKCREVTPT